MRSPYRTVYTQTDCLDVRYYQYRKTRVRTDSVWIGKSPTELRVLVLDTNIVPTEAASSLQAVLARRAGELLDADCSLMDWFHESSMLTEKLLVEHELEPERSFVNASLIAVCGRDIAYTGAYAPIYVYRAPCVENHALRGRIWGVAGLESVPVEIGRIHLEAGQNLFQMSDGMLEEKNAQGRINGDSVLYDFCRSEASKLQPEQRGRVLARRYLDADAERDDSHGLLAISDFNNGA